MIPIESSRFFDCEYAPEHTNVKTAYLEEHRSFVKREENIRSGRTFLCGCCKRPLKIAGGDPDGKKRFHFMHIDKLPEGECEYYDEVRFTKDQIKAMIFNGRTESIEHQQTKTMISEALTKDPNVRQVAVEEVAKNVGKTWRKPDIRVDFKDGKTVVLEVQLSPIFLHVILERNDAYRENGWYICWIFDDVNDEDPNLRKLDTWVNNNYNMFGFDDEAKQKTGMTGRLHLTVRYFRFSVIEDGLNSRFAGEWLSKTVPFDELTFDGKRKMVYFFDSESERKKCEERIWELKSKAKYQQEELRRISEERDEVTDFINGITLCIFDDEKYRLILEYIDRLSEEEVELMTSDVTFHLKTFELDALNKWLKIAFELAKRRNTRKSFVERLWNYSSVQFLNNNRKIRRISLNDYLMVFGSQGCYNAIGLLLDPFNFETYIKLESLSALGENLVDYAPLTLLGRYNKSKHTIPDKVLSFFSENQRRIWCLISAQSGKPFGYSLSNLKQVANHVCKDYPEISHLFLYLIERNGFKGLLSDSGVKNDKRRKDHYQNLKDCVASNPEKLTDAITFDDLDIMLPQLKSERTKKN